MFQIQLAAEPGPVNVPIGPLVKSPERVVNPDSTKALIDAVREGFITSQEIADRIGTLGQTKRAAEVQLAREAVDPIAINARKAAATAANSAAMLNDATAKAQLPLVGPRADYEKNKIAREKAGLWQEYGLKAHEETGRAPVYFEAEDGTLTDEVDAEQTAASGARAREAKQHMEEAHSMLQGKIRSVYDIKLGQNVDKLMNARDEDVTPGSDAWNKWNDKFHDGYDDYYYPPKIKPRKKGGAASTVVSKTDENRRQALEQSASTQALVREKRALGGAANTLFNRAPTVAPLPGTDYAAAAADLSFPGVQSARTWLTGPVAGDLRRSDAEVARMTDQQVADAWRSGQVLTPKTAGRVVIQPPVDPAATAAAAAAKAAEPPPEDESLYTGVLLSGPPELPKVIGGLKDLPAYSDWSEKITAMAQFKIAATRIQAGPTKPSDKGPYGTVNMRQKDMALIQACRKLAVQTASATGRALPDLQTHALEDQMSNFEKLADWKQTIMKTGTLSDVQREQMIAFGNDIIKTSEDLVRPTLHHAAKIAGKSVPGLFGENSAPDIVARGGTFSVPNKQIRHGQAVSGSEATSSEPNVYTVPSGTFTL